jgi:polyisoprenoid-binding protein YceI
MAIRIDRSLLFGALVALAVWLPACSWGAIPDVPAGAYSVDKAHASVIFRVDHLGFSHWTGRMSRFDASLWLDPVHPGNSRVEARIDPSSLESDNPPPHFLDMLHGPDWLDAAKYPQIRFRSTKIVPTGAGTARITGNFTLHGVTRPIVLEAPFNGGYPGMQLDPHARIGFSAHGIFKRSDFGIAIGLPPKGSHFGVGDDVDVAIEAEFSGPAWSPPKNAKP